MIYFGLSNSLQLQYDGILMKLKGNFVSKEVYLLDGDILTALGRPYSVCISLKDGSVSEERAFEQWNGIEGIMNSGRPLIVEGTLMGELMRYLLMRLRRVLRIIPYADEHMLSVLRGKLNEKFRYYDVSLVSSETLVSDMRLRGSLCAVEDVLKVISEPSATEEALNDMDLPYMARLMGLCRYEEAAPLYEEALRRVDASTMIGTELAMCLAETYYFLDRPEDSAEWYLKCDRRYIKDTEDYRLKLGHALLDMNRDGDSTGNAAVPYEDIKAYYKGRLNPTYKKYNKDEYGSASAAVEKSYEEYRDICLKLADEVLMSGS